MTSADPFMIRAHVAHWEASVADYRVASESTRHVFSSYRTVAYGAGDDEKLDLYFPAGGASAAGRPIHLFVHGGYWRAFSKNDYAFVADTITEAGAIAAVMDYSLLPHVRMDVLVAQVRRAAHWLHDYADDFGGCRESLSASGHSAGAHLASFLVCHGAHEDGVALPRVRSLLLVSGIYDLDPITRSFLQPELKLSGQEVARWSPIRAAPTIGAKISLLVGGRETAPFHDQALTFAGHLDSAGARSRLTAVHGEDHMTIVRELGRPGSRCARHLAALIGATRLN